MPVEQRNAASKFLEKQSQLHTTDQTTKININYFHENQTVAVQDSSDTTVNQTFNETAATHLLTLLEELDGSDFRNNARCIHPRHG